MKARRPAKQRVPEPPVDARVRRSKDRVLRTTFDLLVERGLSGVSVDEVSERSGVAKTTIYRHWRTRSDLVFEACSLVSGVLETPDTGSLERDLTLLLLALAKQLKDASWPLVLPSVIDAGERSPEFADAFAQRQRDLGAPYRAVLERGKARGELSRRADDATLIARLVGPLFYRRWFTREALDDAFVKAVVRGTLAKS